MDNVLINFVGKTDELEPAETVLDSLAVKSEEVGTAWKKASEKIDEGAKKNVSSTSKLYSGIKSLAEAAKSLDKSVIGGAYANFLKQIQTQLNLTNKELALYLINAKQAAQAALLKGGTKEEIEGLKITIEVLDDQLKKLGGTVEVGAGKIESLKAQLSDAKRELGNMLAAGQAGTPAFETLFNKAAELDDQIKDLNKSISQTGSDTKAIDGLISLTSGIAAGYAVAKGAAALFGAENDDVQKALLKVNAAMAILQGLQSLQNVLQKESAASILLGNVARAGQVSSTTAAAGATAAQTETQQGLNTAMKANPVGIVITGVLALVTAISLFSDAEDDAAEKTKAMNELLLEQFNRARDLADIYTDDFGNAIRSVEIALAKASVDGSSKLKVLNLQLDELGEKQIILQQEFFRTNGLTYLEELRKKLLRVDIELNLFGANLSSSQQKLKDAKISEYNLLKAQIDVQKKLVQDYFDTNLAAETKLAEIKRYKYEQDVRSAQSATEAQVATRKAAIFRNQVDSIRSIKAVTDAEIAAINKKVQTEKDLNPNLTAGEIRKLEQDAVLQILQLRKDLQLKLINIKRAGISAELIVTQEGTKQEYDAKIKLINVEQEAELAAAEVTASQVKEIKAKFEKQRQEALLAYQVAQLQNEISSLSAQLDIFGLTEQRKLILTLDRLDKQRELEILQAQKNASKILEINAKYDKQRIEAHNNSVAAILQKDLEAFDVFSARAIAAQNRILDKATSSPEQRVKALRALEKLELDKLAIQEASLKKQQITQEEYNIKYQDIQNKKEEIEHKTQKAITEINKVETTKRLELLKQTLNIMKVGLEAVLDPSGFKTALTQLFDLYTKIKDVLNSDATGAEKRAAIITASILATQAVLNQVFEDSNNRRQQALNEELTRINQAKEAELAADNLTTQQRTDINNRYREKEKQAKRQAWIADRDAKKGQAIINGILAASNAIATQPFPYSLIVAGILGSIAAAEVINISNQQVPNFRHGIIKLQGPGTETSDSIPANLSKGESVINAKSTHKWEEALRAINADKFENYLLRMMDFVFPHTPDKVPENPTNVFDYEKLAELMAVKMKGVIPGARVIKNVMDRKGFNTYLISEMSSLEIANERYSMD